MARMRKYGESKTTRIMMATVPHVTSCLGLRKFQADGFLFTRVYKFVWVCTDSDEVRTDFDKFVLWTMSKILVMIIAIYRDQKRITTAENFILLALIFL